MLACGPSPSSGDSSDGSDAPSSAGSITDTTGTNGTTGATTVGTTSVTSVDTGSSSEGSGEAGSSTGAERCVSPVPEVTFLTCNEVLGRLVYDGAGSIYAGIAGGLARIPSDGGDAEILVPDVQATRVYLHGGYLYWPSSSAGELARVELATGTAEVVVEGLEQPNAIAADDAWVYATTYEADGKVVRAPAQGGAFEVLYPGLDHPGELLRDGTSLYFVDVNDGYGDSPILQGTVDGAPLMLVDNNPATVPQMQIRDARIYWAVYSFGASEIRARDLPAVAGELLATTELQPLAIALLTDRVAWSEVGAMGRSYALRSVSIVDRTVTDHLVDVMAVYDLVATPEGLVFATDGAIARFDGLL